MSRRTRDGADAAVRGIVEHQRRASRNGRLRPARAGRRERRLLERGRSVRRFSAVAIVALALAAPLAIDPGTIADHGGAEAASEQVTEAEPETSGQPEDAPPADGPEVFARHGDLELVLPGEEVRLVAYHEAAFPDALPLDPVGNKVANDNRRKFTDPGASDGPDYAILNARDRPTAATSAVDIAVDPGTPVLSLVTGVVTDIEEYWLYGRHRDHRIELQPDGHPDLRVVIIHVEQPEVEIGEEVVAAETVIAPAAVLFPFESQIDRYVGEPRGPHIHVELKHADAG